METEDHYPYVGYNEACKADGSGSVTVGSYADVPVNDPNALFSAIQLQPVSVAIEAD